jgi:Fe-S-cluster containining protein
MNTIAETDFNQKLAAACQSKCASCCCKGMIFLPENEFQAIKQWVSNKSPADLSEFEQRTKMFDGFRLYDQKDRCQFLDQGNLCRLHSQGVKPTECFWWPFHVYAASDKSLEIRLSTSCCDGYKYYTPNLPFLEIIESQAKTIG